MFRMVPACIVLALTVMACSPFAPETQVAPEQQAISDAVCAQVMGIWTGDVYYARCQESVSSTLAARTERQAMLFAYKECNRQGVEMDTTAFSSCMLDAMAKPATPAPLTVVASAAPDTEPGLRFDYISPAIQLNRERYACAQLDLLPGSGPFGDCVASLEDALIPNKY